MQEYKINNEFDQIYKQYKMHYDDLLLLAEELRNDLTEYLSSFQRIDRICVRVKSPERFSSKAIKTINGKRKYTDPFKEIQDQIGARVITYYLSDVEKITKLVTEYYGSIEITEKRPDSFKEFGYFGKHFILFIPDEIRKVDPLPIFFELQIKTLFQHAWAECEHDLNYKSDSEIKFEDKQYIAYSSAQAWGADKIFDELFLKYNK